MLQGNAYRYTKSPDDGYRRYVGDDRIPKLSVTTFTDIISKGRYFNNWHTKYGIKLLQEHKKTQVLTHSFDYCVENSIDDTIACDLVNQYINYRAYIGTMSHSLLLMFNEGVLKTGDIPEKMPVDINGNISYEKCDVDMVDIPSEVILRLNNYEKYFYNLYNPVVLGNEIALTSPRYIYAGTIDVIYEINGEKWLIDYKTGNYIYPEHHIQLMMYKELFEAVYYKVDHIGILHLKNKPRRRIYKIKEIQ